MMPPSFSRYIALIMMAILPAVGFAGEETSVPVDTVSEKKPNLITRIIDYFGEANKEHPDKKIDFTF